MDFRFIRNVLLKATLAFLLVNALLIPLHPSFTKQVTLFNHLVPGRARLPFGENPSQAYNLSLFDLDAMLASHEVAQAKGPDEFRVVLVGDSSVWGTLLHPEETLSGQLNGLGLTCQGRPVRFYNLGYPTISLTKDVLILQEALLQQPDLVIWPLTLAALPRARQLTSPLVSHNAERVNALIEQYHLDLDTRDLTQDSLLDKTLIGRRRGIADWFRLQMYGVLWAATGIDQYYPETYPPAQTDLEPDPIYEGWSPPDLPTDGLALDVLQAGMDMAAPVPVLLVNEPMLVSSGENSDIRYNFFYPRWAYDQYREILAKEVQSQGWHYLDLWDLLPPTEFTNSAIHLTPKGTQSLAKVISGAMQAEFCR